MRRLGHSRIESGVDLENRLAVLGQRLLQSLLRQTVMLKEEETQIEALGTKFHRLEMVVTPRGIRVPHSEIDDLREEYRSRVQHSLEMTDRVRELIGLLNAERSKNACDLALTGFEGAISTPLIPILSDLASWRAIEAWTTYVLSIQFRRSWDFFAELLLPPQEVDDFLDMQERRFAEHLDRYGLGRAKFLYRRNALRSIWPYFKWTLHRLAALEAFRRFFH
jgi:hypothetical protein